MIIPVFIPDPGSQKCTSQVVEFFLTFSRKVALWALNQVHPVECNQWSLVDAITCCWCCSWFPQGCRHTRVLGAPWFFLVSVMKQGKFCLSSLVLYHKGSEIQLPETLLSTEVVRTWAFYFSFPSSLLLPNHSITDNPFPCDRISEEETWCCAE